MQGRIHLSYITKKLAYMRRTEYEKAKSYNDVDIPKYEKAMVKLCFYNKALVFCEYLPEYVDYSTLNNFKIAYIASSNNDMLAIVKLLIDVYQEL